MCLGEKLGGEEVEEVSNSTRVKMEGVDQPSAVSCRHVFRAIEYIVSLQVVQGSTLVLTVEDRLTADQWRGEFDARCEYAALSIFGRFGSSVATMYL